MATRKPTDTKPEGPLPGEADVARVYRAAAQDAPPAALDARILAEAERAVAKPKARGPFGGHWAIPLSTAAVVVLAVGVVLLLSKQGALDHRTEPEVPSEYSAAPAAPLADRMANDARQAAEPAKAKRNAPETAARLAESAESKPAAPAATKPVLRETPQGVVAPSPVLAFKPEEKKSEREAPAPAAAPMRRERMVRDEISAKSKVAKEAGGMNVQADVIAVQASGQPGAYRFNVTVKSPDTGCQQYADWWEVVGTDGKLFYRRVLLHSHVDEQPFTRSGGPVPIQADTVVWVRAHMNTRGYGGTAFKGSVKSGFKPAVPDEGFAAGLVKQPPLPDGCDF